LESGATITRITYKKSVLTIRGNAKKASDVLANINNFDMVESASFDGPVRTSRGNDVFVIKIMPRSQS